MSTVYGDLIEFRTKTQRIGSMVSLSIKEVVVCVTDSGN